MFPDAISYHIKICFASTSHQKLSLRPKSEKENNKHEQTEKLFCCRISKTCPESWYNFASFSLQNCTRKSSQSQWSFNFPLFFFIFMTRNYNELSWKLISMETRLLAFFLLVALLYIKWKVLIIFVNFEHKTVLDTRFVRVCPFRVEEFAHNATWNN